MKYLHTKKNNWHNYEHFISGILTVIDGLVKIVTFGTCWSDFSYSYTVSRVKKACKKL